MGRMYSAQFTAVAVTVAQDLFEINAPATGVVILHSVVLGQNTEEGDAQDEMLGIAIKRGAATSGSGGSTPTAQPLDFGDAAFEGTVEVNNTTIASTGTIATLHSDAFNVRAGWLYRPTPEERIVVPPSGRLTVHLLDAPNDSITFSGTALFEELGGS